MKYDRRPCENCGKPEDEHNMGNFCLDMSKPIFQRVLKTKYKPLTWWHRLYRAIVGALFGPYHRERYSK